MQQKIKTIGVLTAALGVLSISGKAQVVSYPSNLTYTFTSFAGSTEIFLHSLDIMQVKQTQGKPIQL